MAHIKTSSDSEQIASPDLGRAGAVMALSILLVIAFALRFRVGYYQQPYFDGCGFIMHAWSLIDWKLTTPYWSNVYDHYYQPVYPFLISVLYRVNGNWIESAKLANHLLGALLLIPFYFLGRRIYGTVGGVFCAALLVSYPILLENSSNPMSEPAYLLFFGCGLYFLLALIEEKRPKYAVFTGLFFGISYLSRAQALIFLPITLLHLAWLVYRKQIKISPAAKYFLLIAASFYFLVLPYDLYCFKKDGAYAVRAKQEFFKKIGEPQTKLWWIEERNLDPDAVEFFSYTLARQSSPAKYIITNPQKYLRQVALEFRHSAKAEIAGGGLINPLIISALLLSFLALIKGWHPAQNVRRLSPYGIWIFFFALIPPLTAPVVPRYFIGIAPLLALFGAGGMLCLRDLSFNYKFSRWLGSKSSIALWAIIVMLLFPHKQLLSLSSRENMEKSNRDRRALAGWVKSKVPAKEKIIMSADPYAALASGNYWYMLPLDWPMRTIKYAQAQGVDYVLVQEEFLRWADTPPDWSAYFFAPFDKPGLKFVASYPEEGKIPSAILYKLEKPKPGPAEKPNLIFISLGSLRPDHLSAYGYAPQTSPNIDALAEQGIIFENAFTASVSDGWGLLAMLSSVWLDGTIHIAQIIPQVQKEVENVKLDLLPSMLSRNGYQVYGFGSGLKAPDPQYSVQLSGIEMFRPGLEKLGQKDLDNILSSLDSRDRNRPLALFLAAPGGLLEPENISGPSDKQTVEEMVSSYDANIKNVDAWLGKFFQELRARDLLNNRTLVVVSSDHGVEFGEHGRLGHDQLYKESTRVPLIFYRPNYLPGKVVKSQVRTIDVVPTIFDLFGLPMPGQVQGASLMPMFDADIDLPAFMENSEKEQGGGAEIMRVDQALRSPLWLFYQTKPEPLFFHLVDDQSEKVDLTRSSGDLFPGMPEPARDQIIKQIQNIREHMSGEVKNYNYYDLRHLKKFSIRKDMIPVGH